MSLLLQLHADLPERFPAHDRRLHLFSCRRKTCRRKPGSVRVLRSSRLDPSQPDALPTAKHSKPEPRTEPGPAAAKPSLLGNDLFGGGGSKPTGAPGGGAAKGNPFALGGSGAGAKANPFALGAASELASKPAQRPSATNELAASFAEKARLAEPASTTNPTSATKSNSKSKPKSDSPPEPWPTDSSALRPYPHFHLDADYEALGAEPAAPEQRVQVMEVEDGEGGGGLGGGSSSNIVDDAAESSMDSTFQKFADRLAHNPEQVLRYEFEGRPLQYSKGDVVGKMLGQGGAGAGRKTGIPACEQCGGQRVFECQLTPQAIAELEEEEDGLEGMEWGTVIVGVCARDCLPEGTKAGSVGYVEEWAGVQWEESKK